MEPTTIVKTAVAAAKALLGIYKGIEAKNKGHAPEQLKARLDSLDDVVQMNLQIIDKLSAQVAFQTKLLACSFAVSAATIAFVLYVALK